MNPHFTQASGIIMSIYYLLSLVFAVSNFPEICNSILCFKSQKKGSFNFRDLFEISLTICYTRQVFNTASRFFHLYRKRLFNNNSNRRNIRLLPIIIMFGSARYNTDTVCHPVIPGYAQTSACYQYLVQVTYYIRLKTKRLGTVSKNTYCREKPITINEYFCFQAEDKQGLQVNIHISFFLRILIHKFMETFFFFLMS